MSEVVLDPSVSWLNMGTRSLGDQPWLIVDANQRDELAQRVLLLERRSAEVLAEPPDSAAAAEELLGLVEASGATLVGTPGDSPLERIGKSVQEDFCLLRRGPHEWHLGAAVLCFPSRWRLSAKLGLPLAEVHGPTPGYDPKLASRVTSLLDRLGSQIVRRRNWFIHPDSSLFQPDRSPEGDQVVPAERCMKGLFLRSERQTLRLLPESGWIAFTIRIQHSTLGEFCQSTARREQLLHYLAEAPAEDLEHRGMSSSQVGEMVVALR